MEADKSVVRHTFENLSRISGLVHGVFTRHGGVSAPPFASLNAAWNIGDSQDAVRENLSRIKTELGLRELVVGPQVHGDTIHVIDEDALSRAEDRPPVRVTLPGDALVTQLRGVGLMIKVADCQAIFLVDPVRRVIANIHSGWRGSVCNLAAKTVRCMHDHYGCRPEDMVATIGPSLGPCCAEFKNYREELPTAFWRYQVKADYFDFWAISRDQLIQAGLRDENIEVAGRCTVCETNHFFSYRGERTTGRLAAVVGWKS